MMHDDDLRRMVREALARHLGGPGGAGALTPAAPVGAGASWPGHVSHDRFLLVAPTEPGAPCVVEPEVACHHCGFCQSYGH
ncbi:MAG: hypothetical protein ACR2LU_01135 [Luteitalea sp.]